MKKRGKYKEYYFLELPAEEMEKLIEAMKKAEQENDVEALKWCARRMVWLNDISQIIIEDDPFYPERIFNMTWNEHLKNDPVPESIKEIIAQIDGEPEPPTAAAATEALETIKTYLEYVLGGKTYRASSEKLTALQEIINMADLSS
ncbi:MAG: hypothetical protein FWC21_04720 [Treponema sp.]|nr:hypothetical protein [Treponema sp.]